MVRTLSLSCICCCVLAAPLAAQPATSKTQEELDALYAAHEADFDYLLGDWEFTAESAQFGEFRGYWSAVRLDGGQILDEYRVVGDDGSTFFLTTTIRAYNALLDRWELIGMDQGNGLQDFGTAQRDGDELRLEQRYGALGPNPTIRRITYSKIAPDSFSWASDLSTDDGKTWAVNDLRIEAHRIGAPRLLGPLAVARTRN
jgi:hypothetical protein